MIPCVPGLRPPRSSGRLWIGHRGTFGFSRSPLGGSVQQADFRTYQEDVHPQAESESRPLMYNDLLDSSFYHKDDITVIEPALNAVNFIKIDYDKAAARNIQDILDNIAREAAFENPVLTEMI